MQSGYRDLRPAPLRTVDSSSTSNEESGTQQFEKRKGKLIKIACRVCQRRRVKCDGQRPDCSACTKRGETCIYDFNADADTTRYQALKRKHVELEQLSNQNVEVLELLRERPRSEALAIFEQIRSGESFDELLRSVKDGDLLVGLSSPRALRQGVDLPDLRERLAPPALPPLLVAIASVDMEQQARIQANSPRRHPVGHDGVGWLRK